MFTQPQTVLMFAFVGAVFYWLIPPSWVQQRIWWLVVVSLSLIAYEAPQAVLALVAVSGWVYVAELMLFNLKKREMTPNKTDSWTVRLANQVLNRRFVFWLAVAGLIAPMLYVDLSGKPVAILGLSYVIIKSFGVIVDASTLKTRAGLGSILLLNSFFPIFSSGPIEDRETFTKHVLSKPVPTHQDLSFAVVRIAEGFFLTFYIGQEVLLKIISRYNDRGYLNPEIEGWAIIFLILLKFLYLYVNFSGYTSISIGLARLVGIPVSENFNYPFLARNPQEFWQRWHMSLGKFLSKYLYLRMVVSLRRPYFALFIAFVIVGLWHNIGLQYLLWGIGHGGMLVLFLMAKRKLAFRYAALPSAMRLMLGLIGCVMTICWVATLSFMANAPDLKTVGEIFSRVL
ncbi:MAG: MBOAT family O-acyltransferase [Paracoccaceae bacterium]